MPKRMYMTKDEWKETLMTDTNELVEDRDSRYGGFNNVAVVSERLVECDRESGNTFLTSQSIGRSSLRAVHDL